MTDQTDSELRLTHQAPPPPLWTLQSGGSIVSILPKAKFPLAQVVRRLSEQAEIQKTIKTFPYLTKPHNNGPIPDRLLNGCQYLKVETERYTLKVNHKDSCVRIDGKICRLQNIVSLENDIFLVYKVFQGEENFFTTPLESRLLGIVKVSNLDNILHVVKISELQSKCVILPFKTKHIAIPFTDAEWSKKLKYAVVEFTGEDEVEVVPVGWLADGGNKCNWPNIRSTAKISSLIKADVAPKDDFKLLPIRVLAKTADYEDARKKCSKATYTSDLQTDAEDATPKRAKRPNPRFIPSESEEEDEEETLRRSPRKNKKTLPSVPSLPPLPSLPSPPAQASRPSCNSTSNTLFDRGPMSGQAATEKRLFNCLEKLLTNVEELKVQTNINTRLLQSMNAKIEVVNGRNCEDQETSSSIEIDFPLKTKEELEKLEDLLLSCETTKNLVRSLSTIGGENIKTNVRRLLAYMFSTDLAKAINWIGKGGKTAFSTLKIKDVLTATVRKNRLCSSATDSEIFEVAKNWFRFASDRDGGRKKREEKKKEKEMTDQQSVEDQTQH